jgi:sulfur carrier protein ThiS
MIYGNLLTQVDTNNANNATERNSDAVAKFRRPEKSAELSDSVTFIPHCLNSFV